MAWVYIPLCENAQEPFRIRFIFYSTGVVLQLTFFMIGIDRNAVGDDPQLGSKRHELVAAAAQRLADARMIIFDRSTGSFTITDLGRIAAKYYIRYTSIEIFNKEFRPRMSEADVLKMLSMSTEVT